MLSLTDFDPKGTISGVRVQAGLYLDMLDADGSPNAVCVHAGTSQVDFEVDRPPPAACPPRDLLITMKETVILYKKKFRKMKKSRISHCSESAENAKWLRDCLWLCQACKRGFTCRPMERNFRQEAHSYPQADICSAPHSDHDDTHTYSLGQWNWVADVTESQFDRAWSQKNAAQTPSDCGVGSEKELFPSL